MAFLLVVRYNQEPAHPIAQASAEGMVTFIYNLVVFLKFPATINLVLTREQIA
ncbi:hypothetical protein SCLCIDRAFT_1211455 [Scleroderma citrinum Foug A]|uniref:Uncharacterized protein n=1 Tax=Scleroderma citrinum Foug A TaxID=1036808 RepID=A0A0C3AMN1_9AGAM|nr:hypothetical protein SCLCIDRAFT_1211455 [Scleroderma citrinum Foug A]